MFKMHLCDIKLIQANLAEATEQTETKNTRHTKCNNKQHGTIYNIPTVKWNEIENFIKIMSKALNVNCLLIIYKEKVL